MQPYKTHLTCAICQAPLSALHAQTCMCCGKTVCIRHAQLQRKAYSRVLFSFCTDCRPQRTASSNTPSSTSSLSPALHAGRRTTEMHTPPAGARAGEAR
jgi:hypothetical protein